MPEHEVSESKAAPISPPKFLQRNIDVIAKVEAAVLGERTLGERIGRAVIRYAGTPLSVLIHACVILLWIAWNSGLANRPQTFDPYPFNLLSPVASIEAIVLGLLILTSQNRLQQEADRRAHLNLQINMMAEIEGTKVLQMLDELCSHFGLESQAQEMIDDMKAETNPEVIVESIKTSMPLEE